MIGLIRFLRNKKSGWKSQQRISTNICREILFAVTFIVLTLVLLFNGIMTSHKMSKTEQQEVTMLKRLVIGIGDNNTVNLVTTTLGNQIYSNHRYPLESGVTTLPDTLPITEQAHLSYPWAVAVSQGKLFILDLRTFVSEGTSCQVVCNQQKLYVAYVDGETASLAIAQFSNDISRLQIKKGFPKEIAEVPYKFAVTSNGISYIQARSEVGQQVKSQWLIDNGETVKNVPYIFSWKGALYAASFTGLMFKEDTAFIKILPQVGLRDVFWNSKVEPCVQFINNRYILFVCSKELPIYRTQYYYFVVDTETYDWCTIDTDANWYELYDNLNSIK